MAVPPLYKLDFPEYIFGEVKQNKAPWLSAKGTF